MNELIEFYTSLIEDTGLQVREDGVICISIGGELIPAKGDKDKVLVLPTREQLRLEQDWSARIAFHPLSESISRGESTIFKIFRSYSIMGITSKVNQILKVLGSVAQDTELLGTLKPKQIKMLKELTKYRKSTQTVVNKIMGTANPNEVDNRLVNVYIKKGGKVGGVNYSRAAIVSFPILEKFTEDELDIKYQNKTDKDQALKLIEVVLPKWDTDVYNAGTNSPIAPNLVAFLESYTLITNQLNSVIKTFSKIKPELEELLYTQDWAGYTTEQLTKMANTVPALDGNTGSFKVRGENKETNTSVANDTGAQTVQGNVEANDPWREILTPSRIAPQVNHSMFGQPQQQQTGWNATFGVQVNPPQQQRFGMGQPRKVGNLSRVQQIRQINQNTQATGFTPNDVPPWMTESEYRQSSNPNIPSVDF